MPRNGSRWWLLAPALFLCAQPALAAGQLRVLLEAEGGARSDGDYEGSTAAGTAIRSQTTARGGFNLNLSYALRRLDLALAYSPFYEQGVGNRETGGVVSGVTHRLDLSLNGTLSERSKLHLTERLLSSPTLQLYGPTLGDTVISPRRGSELFQDFDAEVDTDLTRRTLFFLGAEESLRRFEDSALSDTRGISGRGGLRVHLDAERELEIKAAVSSYRFTGLTSSVTEATAALSKIFGHGSAVRLELGGFDVRSQPTADQPRQTSRGVEGDLQLAHQRERWRFSSELRHGVAPGVGIGRPVVQDNAVVGVSTVGRRLTVGLSASASRSRDFANVPAVDSTDAASRSPRSDHRLVDFVAGTLDTSWSFADRGRLHGEFSRVWQSSSLQVLDNVSYNRYFLGIAFALYKTGETPVDPAAEGGLHVQPDTP